MFSIRPLLRSSALHTTRSFTTTPARSFASITVVGRLIASPEVSTSSNGREVIKYVVMHTVGPPKNEGDRPQADFYRILSMNGPDRLKTMQKGTQVVVTGDLKMNAYKTEDGKTNFSPTVFQNSITTLYKPKDTEQSEREDEE